MVRDCCAVKFIKNDSSAICFLHFVLFESSIKYHNHNLKSSSVTFFDIVHHDLNDQEENVQVLTFAFFMTFTFAITGWRKKSWYRIVNKNLRTCLRLKSECKKFSDSSFVNSNFKIRRAAF